MRYSDPRSLYPNPYQIDNPAPAWDELELALKLLRKEFPDMQLIKAADVKDEPRTLHPEGPFEATVTACEAKKTRKTKDDMLELTLKTKAGKVKTWLPYMPNYRGILERFYDGLAALGVKQDVIDTVDDWDELALTCVKAQINILITHEERDGKMVENVDIVSAADPF